MKEDEVDYTKLIISMSNVISFDKPNFVLDPSLSVDEHRVRDDVSGLVYFRSIDLHPIKQRLIPLKSWGLSVSRSMTTFWFVEDFEPWLGYDLVGLRACSCRVSSR